MPADIELMPLSEGDDARASDMDPRAQFNGGDPAAMMHAMAGPVKIDSSVEILHCNQCDVDCIACAIGCCHMNTEKLTLHELAAPIDAVVTHNKNGHHHVLWNGISNETHRCGSERGNELAHQMAKERSAEKRRANERQVAGDHYRGAMQHWDYVIANDLDYFQGQITKYVGRWKKKNGMQDLEKAQHFLEKYIEEIRAGRITP